MAQVIVSMNNSGGVDWLNNWHREQLVIHGWYATDEMGIDCYALDCSGIEYAKSDFRKITGFDPDVRGCDCCGPPFYWSEW
jgi:hypothetical protein